MEFRWIDWNVDKVEGHGVSPEEAEYVAENATPPFPTPAADGRRLVWGQTPVGRFLQVVYLLDEDGTVFIIHARPLDKQEKRRYRRRKR